jgi:threonyl-tRNA synthetase
MIEFTKEVYDIFDFKYEFELSTRPDKYIGEIDLWDSAEESLKQCLDESGIEWTSKEGDGAFYGPKIDVSI